ncbi:acyltransferase [Fictibacillus sp. FJAT-27399]|uniref:acyltransferase n=1 Tax=Fictibacillus sp. FJAT-27399 TaxID=1729689 RepID=UPI0007843FBA|nr:acyltransferase [Fictibacillus sp. FJAT-27399]
MKKYMRAAVCILYSLVKFYFIKLFHFNKFNFTTINLVSPFTELEIGIKAKLHFGKMIKIKSGSRIRVRKGAEMRIGKNTSLNHGCIFTAHERIIVGENVQFGPNVLIYDHDHDYKQKDGLKNLLFKTTPVEIGDNVWIGANVVILRGTKIGNNCVVGAGCVVKGEFNDDTVIVQKRETTAVQKSRC